MSVVSPFFELPAKPALVGMTEKQNARGEETPPSNGRGKIRKQKNKSTDAER
jgi:hypothetical protein